MPSYRDAQPPGFEITPELKTWETTHRCPRCLCEIYAGEKDGFRIEACGRCGGVWVNGEEAKRALAMGSRAPEELAAKVEAVTRRVVQDEVRPLACPECGSDMAKSKLGNASIDTCAAHGTWFDPRELRTAMGALRGETPINTKSPDEIALERMRAPLRDELQTVSRLLSSVLSALASTIDPRPPQRR